jgi:hypothetical protein
MCELPFAPPPPNASDSSIPIPEYVREEKLTCKLYAARQQQFQSMQ